MRKAFERASWKTGASKNSSLHMGTSRSGSNVNSIMSKESVRDGLVWNIDEYVRLSGRSWKTSQTTCFKPYYPMVASSPAFASSRSMLAFFFLRSSPCAIFTITCYPTWFKRPVEETIVQNKWPRIRIDVPDGTWSTLRELNSQASPNTRTLAPATSFVSHLLFHCFTELMILNPNFLTAVFRTF